MSDYRLTVGEIVKVMSDLAAVADGVQRIAAALEEANEETRWHRERPRPNMGPR